MGADVGSSDCIEILEKSGKLIDRGGRRVDFRRQRIYETAEELGFAKIGLQID